MERRTITQSLSSSGTLQPAETYTVTTLASGEVLSDTFEEGDLVEEDQLLYTLDFSDVDSSQAQEDYADALDSIYPSAKISGTITEIHVAEGQEISSGTKICTIATDDKITIDFYFSYTSASSSYVGQQAIIYIAGYDGTVSGTVERISSSTTNLAGMQMTIVRVKLNNPGLITSDDTASAVIGEHRSYGNSIIHVGSTSIVSAEASGTVSDLNVLLAIRSPKGSVSAR